MNPLYGMKVQEITKDARAKIVDRAAQLSAKFEQLREQAEELKGLVEIIRGWAANLGAEATANYHGARFDAEVSAKREERTIANMPGVLEAMGEVEFLKRCSMTLKTLDVLLPDAETRGLIKKERTGFRTVKFGRRKTIEKAA